MSFRKNESGNVALMLALSLLPIMMLVALSIEFSRQQSFERQASAALDATALAVIRTREEQGVKGKELSTFAQTYFDSNVPEIRGVNYQPVVLEDMGEQITLSLQATMPSAMLSIFGADRLDFNILSSAVASGTARLEVILVLDVSASMRGENIEALRRAAERLIDLVVDPANPATRIGIVPFNNYVNIGVGNRNAAWISVPEDTSETRTICSTDRDAAANAGCTMSVSCSDGGNFSSSSSEGCTTTTTCSNGVNIDDFDVCTEQLREEVWLGCAGSRNAPLFLEDGDYVDNPILGVLMRPSGECRPENAVLELTNNADLLKRTVDELIPGGNTYMATGLLWGSRALSSQAPFDTASFSDTPSAQAIILLSDGNNTRGRNINEPDHEVFTPDVANADTIAACEKIRDNGVKLYTIDFGIDDVDTEILLRDCATSIDFAFEANNSNQLISVFNTIGSSFREVALSR